MERTFGITWRDEHRLTKFPLADQATLQSEDGQVLLEGMFLDAMFYPAEGGVGTYLASLTIDHDAVSFVLADDDSENRATAECSLLDPPELIQFTDPQGRPAGVLVCDPTALSALQGWGLGLHVLGQDATLFCASVCWPAPRQGVQAFVLADGTILSGDVWLVGADGIVLSHDTIAHDLAGGGVELLQVVRVDVVGDPLFRRSLCTPVSLFVTPRFLKTIRFVGLNQTVISTPNEHGEVLIQAGANQTADPAFRISTTPDGLEFLVAGTTASAAGGGG